uniref:Dyskerin-like domain-containing protein n=1 Tax=Oryza brachyantha TaxID=4533 RepID=J3MNC5_ORYBR
MSPPPPAAAAASPSSELTKSKKKKSKSKDADAVSAPAPSLAEAEAKTDGYIIKPQSLVPSLDTSTWPLLLKNYDRLNVRTGHYTPLPS